MAGTRSSARQAANNNNNSSPQADQNSSNGTKRKADATSPTNTKKKGRPSKEQMTLEETIPDHDTQETGAPSGAAEHATELDMDPAEISARSAANGQGGDFVRPPGCWFWLDNQTYAKEESKFDESKALKKPGQSWEGTTQTGESKDDPEKSLKDSRGGLGVNVLEKVKADPKDTGKTNKDEGTNGTSDPKDTSQANGTAVEEDGSRASAMPSNILEKGVIYFFTRGRVGVDNPESPQDLQRSYFVLRPLPHGSKLTPGAIQDNKQNRLLALPKKVWPKSGKDRFMVFVEKAKVGMDTLKEEFFSGSEYSTKTTGTRQTPDVTPVGEGVYAITTTGGGQGATHLAYMLTIPSTPGDVQQDIGIKSQGSFALSLKNPKSSGPANAQLPQGADYPQEVFDEFRGRGWMPPNPSHLDYENAQVLIIGEDFEKSDNLEQAAKDERKGDKETPQEELEKLEGEDEVRVERMQGEETVFADLGISSKEYPEVMTTW